MPTPYIDITNGQVTPNAPLKKGQFFYWYNPNANDVAITIEDCGTWCVDDHYVIPQGQQYSPQAQILSSPNQEKYAWVEVPYVWTGGGDGPHLGLAGPGPGTPTVDIQTGAVTGNMLPGQPFNWNNLTGGTVLLSSCGTWCGASKYAATPGLSPASMAPGIPNGQALAWTESPNRWNTGGMPHTQGPIVIEPDEEHKHHEHEKEVA